MNFVVYPSELIYAVLGIGILISVIRPYYAFLFSVFCITSVDIVGAKLTRSVFGVYFNLLDAFIVIILFACFIELAASSRKSRFFLPGPVLCAFIAIILGLFLGIFELGFKYEVMRAGRWALNFPLCFWAAANVVNGEKRVRQFVLTLFMGSALGALSHTIFIFEKLPNITLSGFAAVRNFGFLYSGMAYFLIAATQEWSFINGNRYLRFIWRISIPLFALSVIFAQSRSIWVSVIAVCLVLPLLLKKVSNFGKLLLLGVTVIVLFLILSNTILPEYDLPAMVTNRLYFDQRDFSRLNAVQVETRAWITGNLLFGRGLAYNAADDFVRFYGENARTVSWGHLGYISYLAQLGLFGFLIYAFYIPILGLLTAYRLYQTGCSENIYRLSILGMSCVLYTLILFTMNGSFLQPEMIVPGLIIGACIGQAHFMRVYKSIFRRYTPHSYSCE